MESKGPGPTGVFPHKHKPSSIHISQQSQESASVTGTSATATSTTLQAPLTPRIDISRASSSSYHEDSSPENVFDQVGTGTLQEASGCLELFQEDVDELRSSTEELFFMEKEKGQTECEKPSSASQVSRAPMIFKFDDSQALQQFNQYNRKDSGSSEVAAFLNPSGRTSRISSVGSQGSAVSRLSGASGISRSPSPHKMLVETSFCGPKPIEPTSDASSIEHLTAEIENVILARRGDPTKVVLAEGVEVNSPKPIKSTKEKLQEIASSSPLTPAEAARAAAKEARRKEIEALKVRLNAINQRQLEKSKSAGSGGTGSGTVKKVIGVTPEGTEYIRIKLKPDHLYEDHGISPNEREVEEKEFVDPFERKRKERKEKKEENPNQLSHKSSAPDNRSPSPASTSVSRKSSFCSFFKSKDTTSDSTKPKTPTATSGKGSKLNDKSPLPSPKTTQQGDANKKQSQAQHQSRQPLNQQDKPRLRYYDTPDVIHIPLHTPPEEKEFSALKNQNKSENVDEIKIAPSPSAITSANLVEEKRKVHPTQPPPPPPPKQINQKPKIAPTAQIEKMQSTDELELQEMSCRKPSEEAGSSLWSVEVQRHSSQESQETVISTQPKNELSKNGITTALVIAEKPIVPAFIDTINENPPPIRGRHKKHILFSTKLGSGSEEQIFSTQLSLSKTESQSSQLSEQASTYESPKNEECGTKVLEQVTQQNISNLKHQSSSEVEKVTATTTRSRSDHSDTGSRPHSATRKQHSRSSGEFSKSSKRESSEELLHKMPRENSRELQKQPSPTASYDSQHAIKPNEQQQQQQTVKNTLQHQSSGSRMEISSESDDGRSDVDGCIHKRVSRLMMEDHESTGLVLQESFDDELPYIPTTLPEERSSGVKIVPTKERTQSELITIPVERPRSTTPINPTSLDNFCERKQSDASDSSLIRGEKLRISLPRHKAEQSKEKVQQKTITRRISNKSLNLTNKSWTEFAEQGLQNTSAATTVAMSSSAPGSATKKPERTRHESTSSQDEQASSIQQQLPSQTIVKSHSKKSLTSKWIDFENIPEKRQPPKKITTIPMSKDAPNEKIHNSKHSHHHQRHYVSPEECQCECHESKKEGVDGKDGKTTSSSDDSQPLLDDNAERNSNISTDSSLDCSLENDETNFLLQESSSIMLTAHQCKAASNSLNLDKPFGMDLSVELGGHSNRSSIISQDTKSPDLTFHK
ncbi:hypothetical protein PVAND_010092 [Polypedilum vanderplanki]|uniref:Uncharacterized protein n=1 Tax=Polypedilum vanderplanki TaxID=319348 RepID=A0A9J6CF77_POLVA|nr:hypothetical protein PVAND_010092 [Polypedilum vanderplanki]